MTTDANFEDGTLVIRRTYDHPQQEVFNAWIEASKTSHWWGCANTVKVQSEIEPAVGGTYRHEMTITDVGVHAIEGRFTEYDAPSLLAYDMPGMGPDEMMKVRVEFLDRGTGTEVVLTQTQIPSDYGDIIRAGWTASFARLAGFFEGERRAA